MFSRISRNDFKIICAFCLLFLGTGYVLLFDLFNSTNSNSDRPVVATTVAVANDVRLKMKEQFDWSKSAVKDTIRYGDQIFAGDKSSVTIEFLDGQRIKILENSLVKFDQKQNVKNFKIVFGSMKTQVKKDEVIEVSICGEKHRITSSTDDEITISNSDNCVKPEIKLNKNKVAIGNKPKKNTRALAELTEKVIEKQKPVIIELPAPVLSKVSIVMPADEEATKIEWNKVENADYYTLELADEKAPSVVLKKYETKEPVVEFSPIVDVNQYSYSVQAHSNLPNFVPAPPIIGKIQLKYSPVKIFAPAKTVEMKTKTSDQKAKPQDFLIHWVEVPRANHYKVELANDEDYSEITDTKKSMTNSINVELNEFGKKYYRIKAYTSDGEEMTHSTKLSYIEYNRNFDLRPPQIDAKNKNMSFFFQKTEGQFIRLSWINPQIEKAPSHYVEISNTIDFSNIVKSYSTENQYIILSESITQGQYYWRVKSFSPEIISNWSDTGILSIISKRETASVKKNQKSKNLK